MNDQILGMQRKTFIAGTGTGSGVENNTRGNHWKGRGTWGRPLGREGDTGKLLGRDLRGTQGDCWGARERARGAAQRS